MTITHSARRNIAIALNPALIEDVNIQSPAEDETKKSIKKQVIIQGHRGGFYPDNSLSSFSKSL